MSRYDTMDGVESIEALRQGAERADSLADTAELMGDEAGAERFRAQAVTCRLRAMDLLDG